MTRKKKGSVICALFVMNRFSLKSVTIGKCKNILSGVGGESFKPAVAHDGGVARYGQNIFKTKRSAVGFFHLSRDDRGVV